MVPARHGDQAAVRRAQPPRQLARALDRHLFVAFGVKEEDRHRQLLDGGGEVVLGQEGIERRIIGGELEPASTQTIPQELTWGRADRHHRGGPRLGGRDEGQVAAHARAAQRDPRLASADPLAQQVGHHRDIPRGAGVHRPLALAVPAGVEADRAEPGGQRRAREVVVALLRGAGAVEDHDPAGSAVGVAGEPQRVGQAVGPVALDRERHVDRADPAHCVTSSRPLIPAALSHVFPLGSRVNERGRLEVGGCDLVEVAREFGTPAYVLAEDDLRARARAFADGLAARHAREGQVLFASKAFPCTPVLRVLREEGLGCDVASGGELALARAAGFDPAEIVVHGNAKSIDELEQALDGGVGYIVLDSFDDLERLERLAAGRGLVQPVLIRVTPGVAGETHAAISTGQSDSKFGFGMDDAPEAIDRATRAEHLRLDGLHCHIGSQLLGLDPFRRAVRALATLGEHPVYNLGGGLGVAYVAGQEPPSIADYLAAVADAARAELGPGKRLLLEPGRALVAGSTVTLYTIQTVKRNVSTWVAVDGGMSDNLRPMLYGSRYEAVIADRPLDPAGTRCHLAGKHCESGDVIVHDVELPDPAAGDVVVTPATGAYGYAMANNYNGVPRPPVVFCSGGEARLAVRRETFEDLMSRDVL